MGIDFTFAMLPIARKKTEGLGVSYINGDALALPVADHSVDILSIAFGIRNVSNWGLAIDEFGACSSRAGAHYS